MKDKALVLNNRYQIIGNLGRGSFGETFLAIDTHLPSKKKCVIKQLKPIIQEPQIPPWMQERFQQEARILEHLGEQHPQIPRLYAYFSEAGNFYLVQELIEGLTLKEKVEKEGTLSEAAVTKILHSTLLVLHYVHSQSIVHRDVKPDNIILRASDGLPVLIDFGAVKEAMGTVATIRKLSDFSMVIGTPNYMAPEQAVGRPLYASDLYSLGLTAVYLLTGKSLQELETDAESGEILWREAAFQIHPHLDPHLATILERTIRLHPRDRFASAAEMLCELDSLHTNSPAAISVLENRRNIKKVNTDNQKIVALSKDTNNSLKASFSFLILIVVALGSFNFGFNLLSNRGKTPQPDISIQPDEQILPPRHTNPPSPEQPETNIPKSNPEPIKATPLPSKSTPVKSTLIPTVFTGINEVELVKLFRQPTSNSEKQIQIQSSQGSILLEKDLVEREGDITSEPLATNSYPSIPSPSSAQTPDLSRQMANDMIRGLVMAGHRKHINYGSTMYRKVQSAIRVLRKGESLEEASGVSQVSLFTLQQLIEWGQSHHAAELGAILPETELDQAIHAANDIVAGLLVAGNKRQIKYGSTMYRKVQSAIRVLRKGKSLEEASRVSQVPLPILQQLIDWGQNRPSGVRSTLVGNSEKLSRREPLDLRKRGVSLLTPLEDRGLRRGWKAFDKPTPTHP